MERVTKIEIKEQFEKKKKRESKEWRKKQRTRSWREWKDAVLGLTLFFLLDIGPKVHFLEQFFSFFLL
jgi:hypothetical protein